MNSNPTRLIFLRHGEVEESYQRHFGGRIDMNLSSRGHEQARALAQHLRGTKFDAVYASPMKRVQQTLAPTLTNGAPQPVIMESLREIDFGDWTGMVWEDACARHGIKPHQWLEALDLGLVKNAEPIPAYRARIERCLRQIVPAHAGQTVAVFCHGGVIRAMLAAALEIPLTITGAFSVDYASVTELEVHEDGRFVLEMLNYLPWRDGT